MSNKYLEKIAEIDGGSMWDYHANAPMLGHYLRQRTVLKGGELTPEQEQKVREHTEYNRRYGLSHPTGNMRRFNEAYDTYHLPVAMALTGVSSGALGAALGNMSGRGVKGALMGAAIGATAAPAAEYLGSKLINKITDNVNHPIIRSRYEREEEVLRRLNESGNR